MWVGGGGAWMRSYSVSSGILALDGICKRLVLLGEFLSSEEPDSGTDEGNPAHNSEENPEPGESLTSTRIGAV
jgi:hypothetical protein